MANPQVENGFTKIANEILEALVKTKLTQSEWRVLFFIIRKTYGWHKKIDRLALSQIALGTGIARQNVFRTLQSLIRKNIVLRPDNRHIGFQKDYSKWMS